MPDYDNDRIDATMTKLLNKGYSEEEVILYIKTYKDDYLLEEVSVPKNGKGKKPVGFGGLFTQEGLESLGKQLPKIVGSDMPLGERVKKRAVATFADTYTSDAASFANIIDPTQILTPGKMLTEAGKRRETYMQDMAEIKDVYEKELAENPPQSGLEHFVEAGASVAGIIPDFMAISRIMAPLKSLQGLKYLKNHPRFAKFFAESQRTAATFAGVESKHGPEAAVNGYLAGMVVHIGALPSNPAVKSITLGVAGKFLATLQGATPDQANAQTLLFMLWPLIDMGKSRGFGRGKAEASKAKEYTRAKSEFVRIAEDTGVPKENALTVIKEGEAISRGELPKPVADWLLETHTDSNFRRTINEFNQEISKGEPGQETQNFAEFVDRVNEQNKPFEPEQIIPGEQYSGPRRPKELRSAKSITGEVPAKPKLTPEEAQAQAKELFGPAKHPAAPEKPKTIEAGILAGMEAWEATSSKSVETLSKFDKHLKKGEVRAAQVVLSDAKDYTNRNPQDVEMDSAVTEMIDKFKQVDSGTQVKDVGNKFLRDQNKTEYKRQRRTIGALQSRLGWDSKGPQYRQYLKDTFGVESSTLLTANQINKVVKDLKAMTGESKAKGSTIRPESGKVGREEIILPEQEQHINKRMTKLRESGMTDPDLIHVYESAGLKPDHKIGFQDTKNFTTRKQAERLSRELHLYEETIAPIRARELKTLKDPEVGPVYRKVQTVINDLRGGKAPSTALSMRFYVGRLEELTGGKLPFLSLYEELITRRNQINTTIKDHYSRLAQVNGEAGADALAIIMANPNSQQRISDHIASKSKHKKAPSSPRDITRAELNIANEMVKILDEYKWKVRAWQFYDWKFKGKEIPGYERYKEQIEIADRAYEEGGQEALFQTLKAQTWGVLKEGFEPHEIVYNQQRSWSGGKVGKGARAPQERAYEYQIQDKELFLRFNSYLKRMERGTYLTPHIEAFYETYLRGQKEGVVPESAKADIEIFLRELQGINFIGGPVEKAVRMVYGQAMTSLIQANPAVAFRNLFQNMGFYPDRSDLVNPKNRAMTPKEMEFQEREVFQDSNIEIWMHTSEAFLNQVPGLRVLNTIAGKVKIYAWSDRLNRMWGFWAKKNTVERAMVSGKPLEQKLKDLKFKDMSNTQQKRALEVLSTEGVDAFGNYVAKATVEDVHFIYDRAQRSPAEVYPGSARILLNLALFPRAYAEKLVRSTQKVRTGIKGGKVTPEGARALKSILSVMAGGYLVGEVYKMVTGRQDNPYSPINIISYEVGGLSVSSLTDASKFGTDILTAVMSQDPELKQMAMGRLTMTAPRLGDMFIPYYMLILNSMESVAGKTNMDRAALRTIREMVDKEYVMRRDAYDIERSWYEKWQHALFGAGIDRAIKQREAEMKKLQGGRSRTRSR